VEAVAGKQVPPPSLRSVVGMTWFLVMKRAKDKPSVIPNGKR